MAALTSFPLLIVTRYILIRINLMPGKNCSCSNCATVGDDDSFLELPRRRAQGFDHFNEIHTLNDFACKKIKISQGKRYSLRGRYLPKTTCAPSSQLVTTVVMKNWEPFVFFPALAMDKSPGLVCLSVKFSSVKYSQGKYAAYQATCLAKKKN